MFTVVSCVGYLRDHLDTDEESVCEFLEAPEDELEEVYAIFLTGLKKQCLMASCRVKRLELVMELLLLDQIEVTFSLELIR